MSNVTTMSRATLFWRLAVLRRGIERTRAEIESLCDVSGVPATPPYDDDLVCQLREAASNLEEVEELLKPAPEHVDRDLQTMRPIAPEARP